MLLLPLHLSGNDLAAEQILALFDCQEQKRRLPYGSVLARHRGMLAVARRRASQAQSLWSLALFISAGLSQGQTLHALMTPLLQAVYGR
jgi:hypothetical protein